MKKATALIEMGEDGSCTIWTSDIDTTIIGEGNSVEEAKRDFENSVKEVYLSYEESGRELIDDLKDVEFEYKYDLPSFFRCYGWINASRLAKELGINPSLMRQYKQGLAPISQERMSVIAQTINRIGRELTAVKF
ncbi:MAG: hypothetical protein LBO71_01890 [Prevotellaceae bacterium]|nr:hypothetical protein [Prevotellaceae bacterium]